MTQREVTELRQRYDFLVRERARIAEEIEDVRDALISEGELP
jgi:hypothetical protein